MPAPTPTAETTALVVLVLVILVIARRTVRQIYGAHYSAARLYGFAGFYVLLFAFLAFSTLYAAVGAWGTDAYGLLAAYLALPAVAAYLSAPYIRTVVRFERRDDREWYYRLSWHVPVLYLALFASRLLAEVAVFGPAGLAVTYPPPAPPSVLGLVVLVVVDLLFGVSLGLLIGRGVGVHQAHRDLPSTPGAAPPSPPLPSG